MEHKIGSIYVSFSGIFRDTPKASKIEGHLSMCFFIKRKFIANLEKTAY